MFTALKNILPRALAKNKIDGEMRKLEQKEQAETVFTEMFGGEVEVVRCHAHMLVRVRHQVIANEIKLRDRQIKNQLKEVGIIVEKITCA